MRSGYDSPQQTIRHLAGDTMDSNGYVKKGEDCQELKERLEQFNKPNIANGYSDNFWNSLDIEIETPKVISFSDPETTFDQQILMGEDNPYLLRMNYSETDGSADLVFIHKLSEMYGKDKCELIQYYNKEDGYTHSDVRLPKIVDDTETGTFKDGDMIYEYTIRTNRISREQWSKYLEYLMKRFNRNSVKMKREHAMLIALNKNYANQVEKREQQVSMDFSDIFVNKEVEKVYIQLKNTGVSTSNTSAADMNLSETGKNIVISINDYQQFKLLTESENTSPITTMYNTEQAKYFYEDLQMFKEYFNNEIVEVKFIRKKQSESERSQKRRKLEGGKAGINQPFAITG